MKLPEASFFTSYFSLRPPGALRQGETLDPGVDPDPANRKSITDWCIGYWDAVHPYSAGGAYVNFMMDEGQDPEDADHGHDQPADPDQLPLARLFIEQEAVDVARHHLAAGVEVGADRGHDRGDQPGQNETEEAGPEELPELRGLQRHAIARGDMLGRRRVHRQPGRGAREQRDGIHDELPAGPERYQQHGDRVHRGARGWISGAKEGVKMRIFKVSHSFFSKFYTEVTSVALISI